MAVITPTKDHSISSDGTVQQWTWSALANGDTGHPVEWIQFADRCVSVTGTFGAGGTLVIQGSNDNTNWFTLNNAQSAALSFTASGLKQVVELPRYIRPSVTAGDGTTSLDVILVMRRIPTES